MALVGFRLNHPPCADFCKNEEGGDLGVTQIPYRKKKRKNFSASRKRRGDDLNGTLLIYAFQG